MAIGERPRYWHQYEGLHDVKRTIHVNPKRQLFRLLTLKDQKKTHLEMKEKVKNAIEMVLSVKKLGFLPPSRFYVKSFLVN